MIFPISPSKTFLNPFDPAHRIDREVGERSRRLVIGLSLDSEFRSVVGGLVVVEGNGKYLKVIRSKTCRHELPEITTTVLNKLNEQNEPSLLDVKAVQEDIAVVQAALVEELKREAGKYVDRLLLISVADPGLWLREAGARNSYFPICDPNRLTDATGISVIDAFPTRDISAGGTGKRLEALPAWLMFSDRSPKLAAKNRLLIVIQHDATAYFLPASDGLDVELPEIRIVSTAGMSAFKGLLDDRDGNCVERKVATLNVDGRHSERLSKQLDEIQKSSIARDEPLPDIVRTIVLKIIDELAVSIRGQIDKATSIDEIVVDSHPELLGTWVNQIQRSWPNCAIRNDFHGQGTTGDINSVFAAVIGAMSIDQMPANVPWITGANSQRILGRVTPGSPSNWRQLLREMADFQPPAMRLRDAV